MKLSDLVTLFATIMGVAAIGYDTYWYLLKHNDPSQFIGFALIGVLLVFLVNVLNVFWQKIAKLQKNQEYFEDKFLDNNPRLR